MDSVASLEQWLLANRPTEEDVDEAEREAIIRAANRAAVRAAQVGAKMAKAKRMSNLYRERLIGTKQ